MKKRLAQHLFLFGNVLKWVALAVLSGISAGAGAAVFLHLLNLAGQLASRYPWFFLLLPAGLVVSSCLSRYLSPEAEGHGTEKVIEAVHQREGKISPLVVPVKMVTTLVTVACGGSVGKEGPCAQIGAGLSSLWARVLRLKGDDRKKLVICGLSAGFASVFGTPIAGAIFGVEVLFIDDFLYEVLLPSFVAGITSYQVCLALKVRYLHTQILTSFSPGYLLFLQAVGAGLFFGLVAVYFIKLLDRGKRVSDSLKIAAFWKAVAGGVLLIVLTLIFSRQYLGLGTETIEGCLSGEKISWTAFLLKPVFTSLTLASGGSGGVLTPIFFTGAAAGNLLAPLLGMETKVAAGLGLCGLLAGAANTPLAASVMAMEFFGPAIAPYASLTCLISFLVTGNRSVYPSQLVAFSKMLALRMRPGRRVG